MTNSAMALRSRASTAWARAQSVSCMVAGDGKRLVSSYESGERGESPWIDNSLQWGPFPVGGDAVG